MSYAQGQDAGLVATFRLFAGGPSADLDAAPTITITAILDGTVAVGPTSVGVVHVSIGVYSYVWTIPQDQAVGDYLVLWAGTISAAPIEASETITIDALSIDTWATASDVLAITGSTVDGPTLARAQGDIELHANRGIDAVMSVRDLYWLRRAVSWQAAWLPSQYGTEARSTVTNVSQDGVSTTFPDNAALILAPRARRAMLNLSWLGTRSLRIRPRRRDDLAFEASYEPAGSITGGANFTSEASDDAAPWLSYPDDLPVYG